MTERTPSLVPGELVPHFTVRAIDGHEEPYSRLWQRRNLLLVCLPAGDPAFEDYAHELASHSAACDAEEAACIVTVDAVPGVPMPGALVADRWGEIFHVQAFRTPQEAPGAAELVDMLAHVRMKCPECEGEAR
jgi:hypothetical protein